MARLGEIIQPLKKRAANPGYLRKLGKATGALLRTLLLIGMSFIILYPLLYMVSTVFRNASDYYDPSIVWIPSQLTWSNIVKTYQVIDFPTVFANTATFTLVSAVLQVFTCAFVGYGFARFNFKFKNTLFVMVLFTIIVPTQTIILPLYAQYRFFDFFGISQLIALFTGHKPTVTLTNTGWIYYLPSLLGNGIRSGLFIYIFRQFFRGLPKGLEDAALIDGCGPFRCYFRVMLPNAVTAIVTVMLFSIVWHWNDYYFSGMLLSSKVTLSMVLANLPAKIQDMNGFVNPVENSIQIQAGVLMLIFPLLVMFAFGQKYFTESIERTGLVE
ncbi:transporter [Paenibacillus baekrokdamisoli]|uniref:Transporter n=1 Tax=Paenibacillus baekrokdamisoli TaxID=1712516 RepID=A0A3G9J1W8_9BACL|nr:carbohydrate ABC transporter permease [Paenibacillus baekrokdamisoli]MBB3069369.1 multiple sugar transport system permease protein [Paenibacillus baekrokdamisoli]BBH18663.1 transporter [Paenibacillus baekrokdamisoli]